MKNPHIELVKKWLADRESVSAKELKRAADAANADAYVNADGTSTAARAVAFAARAANYSAAAFASASVAAAAAARAAYAADANAADKLAASAKDWIKEYDELTK